MKIMPWLRLIRLPNLFSVPGDPVAGFMLVWASGAPQRVESLVLPVLASLCLYAAGLILNDLLDRAEDARERPNRPLPSGGVSAGGAWAMFGLLSGLAMLAAFQAGQECGIAAVVVLILIVFYNGGLKRAKVLGPLSMGLCRGGSVLIGATAADMQWPWSPSVLIAALGVTAYIAGMSVVAREETRRHAPGFWRWTPALAALVTVTGIGLVLASRSGAGTVELVAVLLPGLGAVAWNVRVARGLAGICDPAKIARSIGMYIRGLILVQASLAMAVIVPGVFFAAGLVFCMGASMRLGKWFYSS